MFNTLTFPETMEEFIEQYKVVKGENLYCDGVEFIPVFRMKEWFERSQSQKGKTIDMQAAIEVASRECHEFRGIFADIERGLKELPTEGREKQKDPCEICKSLENGDTLYSMSDWDGGIGFDYIRDIEYCPVCGRKL